MFLLLLVPKPCGLVPSIVSQLVRAASLNSFCFASVSPADLHFKPPSSPRQPLSSTFFRLASESVWASAARRISKIPLIRDCPSAKGWRSYVGQGKGASPNFVKFPSCRSEPCKPTRESVSYRRDHSEFRCSFGRCDSRHTHPAPRKLKQPSPPDTAGRISGSGICSGIATSVTTARTTRPPEGRTPNPLSRTSSHAQPPHQQTATCTCNAPSRTRT